MLLPEYWSQLLLLTSWLCKGRGEHGTCRSSQCTLWIEFPDLCCGSVSSKWGTLLFTDPKWLLYRSCAPIPLEMPWWKCTCGVFAQFSSLVAHMRSRDKGKVFECLLFSVFGAAEHCRTALWRWRGKCNSSALHSVKEMHGRTVAQCLLCYQWEEETGGRIFLPWP